MDTIKLILLAFIIGAAHARSYYSRLPKEWIKNAEKQTCPPGEYYDLCYSLCGTTCETLGTRCHYMLECYEKGRCMCNHGYLRNKNGQCVLPKQC
ncbi:trypsin Inhibitor like cysteine rich domain protein [Oesophagostomum dentatum]|uniref:Trypsin Inhibitor like cysteine rich domain protein n=1 Tax=Oesophagostomum dentatum TaxID=61180 RepID=A0A0B1SNY2_OESDE|nr:trypsin Inhibitor like cysteine rich domain protein [Oesophagostomum dentatum]